MKTVIEYITSHPTEFEDYLRDMVVCDFEPAIEMLKDFREYEDEQFWEWVSK